MKTTLTATFHHAKNYGAFLQSYALQKKLGEGNYILDFNYPFCSFVDKTRTLWFLRAIKRYLKYYFEMIIPNFKEHSKLKISKKYYDGHSYIAGSDQIWNCHHAIHKREHFFFLAFVPPTAKRISYAASLGMPKWPKEFEQMVLPWLRKFNAISVRENSSAEYLRSLGLDAVCVCDPTILHKADFYRKEFNLKKSNSDNYTFIYFVYRTERVEENIPIFDKTIMVDLKNRRNIVSVSNWLSFIDNAQFILTDSFHGVVFSILFHRSFAVFQKSSENGKGMNERLVSILNRVNLEYRILQGTETKEQILEILNREIDWHKIDENLEEWRNYSSNWLNNALEN